MKLHTFYTRIISLFFVILLSAGTLFSQKKYKYGKVSKEELAMSVYSNDSSANAVVLYEDGNTWYEFSDKVNVITDVKCRIKILTKDGADEGTIVIPYYEKGTSRESIRGIHGVSYNLVNGKIEKTKLNKKYIFEEKINDNRYQIKLAIPNVKAGSVIEYKYQRRSPFYYNLDDWIFQRQIPVQEARYEITIPEYFIYNIQTKGYETITTARDIKNESISFFERGRSNRVHFTSKIMTFTVEDLPGLKEENYLWNVSDFLSGIHFELSATDIPGTFNKSYSNTWDDVERTIKRSTDFYKNLTKGNRFKKEVNELKEIADEKERIEAIYQLIKDKIRWNGRYAFTDNPNDAIKDGTGNNAQINSVLISALNEGGIYAYPVLMRRRSQGRLPLVFPSLDKITTFIVAAQTIDGSVYYMDGSAVYGGLDVLPSDLLVDRARTLRKDQPNDWVDLSKIGKNRIVCIFNAVLNDSGELSVNAKSYYRCQPAYRFRQMFAKLNDSTEYVRKFEKENQLTVNSIRFDNIKETMSTTVAEEINCTKQNNKRGDFIYLNPLIIPHITKNKFTASERKLPIEFEYPYSIRMTNYIKTPKGYTVEEIPQSEKYSLPNNTATMTYYIKNAGGVIQINYRFELNEVIFPNTDYSYIRDFWGMMTKKNTEMIVFKKK